MPKDCIITPWDKNVGISVLPYDWYKKEYKVQIIKGGYEPIQMNETSCLYMLKRNVKGFMDDCTIPQKFIINALKSKSGAAQNQWSVCEKARPRNG